MMRTIVTTCMLQSLMVAISISIAACGGEAFEAGQSGSDPAPFADSARIEDSCCTDAAGGESAADAGNDLVADAAGHDASSDAFADTRIDAHADGVVDGINDSQHDAVAEPSCATVEKEAPAEADGMILAEGSNCGASISFTTASCMDLNLSGSRVLVRFALTSAAAAALQAKQVTSAALVLQLAATMTECDSTLTGPAGNVPGLVSTYALRSDWSEGGSYVGAQWCYRRGNGSDWGGAANLWAQSGASGNADHGVMMSSVQLATDTVLTEVALDPVELAAWLTADNRLSVLVTPASGSNVMAYIRTHESGAPAVLRLAWCQ